MALKILIMYWKNIFEEHLQVTKQTDELAELLDRNNEQLMQTYEAKDDRPG